MIIFIGLAIIFTYFCTVLTRVIAELLKRNYMYVTKDVHVNRLISE